MRDWVVQDLMEKEDLNRRWVASGQSEKMSKRGLYSAPPSSAQKPADEEIPMEVYQAVSSNRCIGQHIDITEKQFSTSHKLT